ncbi:tRNA (adenosine(37)-N6)-dimethylallyltransferase MiaA [Lachnospiraceae bacterium MD1]|uniref:tRNA dimethylallyltransferase n=1 Tax=Variimorphobacter saccharofermentans TaxID=2755051 RepID=A0A839K007_9FIRM|nr:tRNA (adenosine(37)-N6)-dimethylallyltransferase MiaA [Variimorphobacter saccharofermentans]MBB2182990.1 tRNA (adenosine(37)-N6)-dimethylallyltransferase MiaA [Variimorphobacter saccharofermentans]
MSKQPLIILSGPTSVGKTELSISLAKAINGEIISADSMQVYKHMDIGTAKIKPHEMGGIPHYLIDELEPDDEFNVVRFQEFAKQYMSMVYEKNKIPIIVGGTGFYIQAVLYDIDFTSTPTDCSYRTELELLLQEHGSEYLHDILKEVDPESAKAIHPNNSKRVIRALEFIKQTGTRISEHNEEQRDRQSPYQYCYFVLNKDRAKLYESINQRVDIMLKEGLVEEVAALRQQGYHRDLVSMQGLGYKEIYAYLEGECTLEEAIYILKRDTRHFAKRQITWFKRERDVIWVNKDDFPTNDALLEFLLLKLREKQVIL